MIHKDAKVTPDIKTYDHLLNLYAIVGDVEKAKLTFEQVNSGAYQIRKNLLV